MTDKVTEATLQDRLRYRATACIADWQDADEKVMLEAADALDNKDKQIETLATALREESRRVSELSIAVAEEQQREIERLTAIEKFAEGLPTLGEIERMRSTIAFLESDIERLRAQRDEVLRLVLEALLTSRRDGPRDALYAIRGIYQEGDNA